MRLVLSATWVDSAYAQVSDKLSGVVPLFGTKCFLVCTIEGLGQPDRHFSLSSGGQGLTFNLQQWSLPCKKNYKINTLFCIDFLL